MRESTGVRTATAKPPPMSEAELQKLLTDAAELYGWGWVHFRPGRTAHGWSTPVSGPLGQGWPDIVLAHPRQRRVLAIECKSDNGHVSAEQLAVHAWLMASGIEVHIVRPSDIDDALEVLRAA